MSNLGANMQAEDRDKFRKTNGLMLRVVINSVPTSWFKVGELKSAMKEAKANSNDVAFSLSYLEDAGYIQARLVETRENISSSDFDEDLIELKLTAEGKKVIMGFLQDVAVEI